jgi:hypothetical protein
MDLTKVATSQYRSLRFSTLRGALDEAKRCAAAAREGRLSSCGTWSPGTLFGHLAFWINAGFDGYPLKIGFFMRIAGRLMKRGMLSKSSRGVRIPGAPQGTFGVEELSVDVGLAQFERAVLRLEAQAPSSPNPLLGSLTHEEWLALHTRHAEGHLGHLVY